MPRQRLLERKPRPALSSRGLRAARASWINQGPREGARAGLSSGFVYPSAVPYHA